MPSVHFLIPSDAIATECHNLPTKPGRHFQPHALQAPAPSISVPSPIPKVSSPSSGCVGFKTWLRKATLPPSLSGSLLSHLGAAAPAQPPARHPRAPMTFILHPFPTPPRHPARPPHAPAAILAVGPHGCISSPHQPHHGEKNMVAMAHLRERHHGKSRS